MLKYILVMIVCLVVYVTPVKGQEVPPEVPPNLQLPPGQSTMPEIESPNGRPYGQIFQMVKYLTCNDTPVVKNYLKNKFGEQPFTYGMNYNMMGVSSMITVMYVNPLSRTYSVVENSASGLSCIVGQGVFFDYVDQSLLDEQKPF